MEEEPEPEEDYLDTSWIENAEFQENYQREPIKEIGLFFIYIHLDGSIQQIIQEFEPCEHSLISKERILHIIQSKRHYIGKKYRLVDLLSFNVTLDPEQLNDFIQSESQDHFLKVLPIFENISLEPSIFIFHDLNGLFFLLKEVEPIITKSILKNTQEKNRSTKKVRISPEEYIEKKKKSLKRMMRRANHTRKIVQPSNLQT